MKFDIRLWTNKASFRPEKCQFLQKTLTWLITIINQFVSVYIPSSTVKNLCVESVSSEVSRWFNYQIFSSCPEKPACLVDDLQCDRYWYNSIGVIILIAYLINTYIQIKTKIILKWSLKKERNRKRRRREKNSFSLHVARCVSFVVCLIRFVLFSFGRVSLWVLNGRMFCMLFFTLCYRCFFSSWHSMYDFFKFYSKCSKQINSGLYHRVTIMCVVCCWTREKKA